jgi:hypothetical protein
MLYTGWYKHVKQAEPEILLDIHKSLEARAESILLMLEALRIEIVESLRYEIQSPGGVRRFLALGMLLEDYGSRLAPPDTIYLASRGVSKKEYCFGKSRSYF